MLTVEIAAPGGAPKSLSLAYDVEHMRWSFFGGPLSASVAANGTETDRYTLLLCLGDQITIYDDADPIWWGYIREVEIGVSKARLRVSLDGMANAVSVAYTTKFSRRSTDWVTDNDSIAQWGRKEMMLSRSELTDAEANTLAANYLRLHRYPQVTVRYGAATPGARIGAYGFLERLDWRYYQNLTGFEGYDEVGSGGREIGEDDRPIAAQSFEIASSTGWTATRIQIRPWKYPPSNPPTDDLIVELCADSGGVPGTVLATATYTAAEIETNSDWREKAFDVGVSLSPGTKYWIKIRRSGAVDASKYYMVDTNLDAGYPRGNFYLYSIKTSTWLERNSKGHLNFRLYGDTSVSSQIETIISTCGGAIGNVYHDALITTPTNPYRSGDRTGLKELIDLLKVGQTSTQRYSCSVLPDRSLLVVQEPPRDQPRYLIDRDGVTWTSFGVRRKPLAGEWYGLKDLVSILPPGVQSLFDFSAVFAEEVEYSRGVYTISRMRAESPDYELGGIG